MTLTTTIIDMPIQLGPDLTEQEWQQVVQGHREAAIERLQTISVTDERYADIERAARGLFWHTDVMGRISVMSSVVAVLVDGVLWQQLPVSDGHNAVGSRDNSWVVHQ